MVDEKKPNWRNLPLEKRLEEILFCPCCFASSENGSWTGGQSVFEWGCINCGAGGENLKMPRWAVETIREQASWVGKRYYPHEEDHENYKERQALLKLVKEFPGRTATLEPDGRWLVAQKLGCGLVESTWVKAGTPEEAMRQSNLRYVP